MNSNTTTIIYSKYHHKKFDTLRLAPVATSTPKRKRFDSSGNDDAESVISGIPKYLKFALEEANDSGICISTTASPGSHTNEIMVEELTQASLEKSPPVYSTNVRSQILARKLPKISKTKLEHISKYHGNMVRRFPVKQRTLKDQERRNKNTLACRQSRFLKKLEIVVAEDEYKENLEKYWKIKDELIRYCFYAQELLKHCAQEPEVQNNSLQKPLAVLDQNKKKSFSIDHILNS